MKLLVLLCACAALASASAGNVRERRFIEAVANFFSNAAHTVKDGVVSAAHAVANAAQTAAHAVAGAAETAVDAIGDAAHTIWDGITDFTSKATAILGPILDQVAGTVGPIAKNILDAAVQQLIQNAPEILATLGRIGVEKLATTILSSAVGKREVMTDLEALKNVFSHLVEEGVNATVRDVHTVVAAVDKFNAVLKKEVGKLEQAVQNGQNVQTAAAHFFHNALAALQPVIDNHAFDLDLSRFDAVIPMAIHRFGEALLGALRHSAHTKRGVLLDLLHQGQQHLGQLVDTVEHLAQGLLAPTIQNAKHIAQTLLDNANTTSSDLVAKALKILAPFQQQLGPVFQQVQTLAANLGLHA